MIKMNKNLVVLTITVLLIGMVSGLAVYSLNPSAESQMHIVVKADSPIRINNDTELADYATTHGWPGDGSDSNPYIIENYHIDVGTADDGIYLGNTSSYVVANNTEIYNVSGSTGSGNGAAIALYNVKNVEITNNSIHESKYYGIYVSQSSNVEIWQNKIENNTLVSSNYGIYADVVSSLYIENNTFYSSDQHSIAIRVHSSSYPYIAGNIVHDFRYGAVDLAYTTFATVWDNEMYNSSIRIEGYSLDHYNHSIPLNNTVNGKAVYYINDTDFGNSVFNPPTDVGELILHNVSNLRIENMNLSYTSTSFLVSFSHRISFDNINAFHTGFHSIFLGMSDNITISNSTVYMSGSSGIYAYMVNDFHLVNTKSLYSHSNGIYAYYTYQISLFNVSILGNYYGFYVYNDYHVKAQYISVENSKFENNTNSIARFNYALNVFINNSKFANNGGSGVELYGFNDNSEITNNTIINNGGYGIYSSHANNVDIENNTIITAGNYGIYAQYQGNAHMENNLIDDTYGLALNGVNYSFILNNSIKNSRYNGIYIAGNSAKTGENLIWGNIVENSYSYGVYLTSTQGNLLFNNSFIHNNGSTDSYDPKHVQAYDDTNNSWNSTKYGNYWADWSTPDNDGDGIVDNPYIIDGGAGAQDYYPLAKSPNIPEFSLLFLVPLLMVAALILLRRR